MPLLVRETAVQATIRMVADARNWPLWPFLPLKNKKEKGDGSFPLLLGFLCAPPPITEVTVFIGAVPIFEKEYCSPSSYPHRKYPNLTALLTAGWVVD